MSGAVAGTVPVGTRKRVPVGGVLTPRAERLIRAGSVGSAVIIAVSAMILSYAGLHDLALDAQIHPRLALLVPVMVDGLQFVGSLGVVYSTLSGLRSWYPWLLMLMGVSISSWGNWQAAPDDLTAKLLHAAAPIILALVLEELLRVMRHKVHMHADMIEHEAFTNSNPQVESEGDKVDRVVEPETSSPTDAGVTQSEATSEPPVSALDTGTAEPDAASEQSHEPSRASTLEVGDGTGPVVNEHAEHVAVQSRAAVSRAPAVSDGTVPQVDERPESAQPAPEVSVPVGSAAEVDDELRLPPYSDGPGVTFKEQVKEILAAAPDTAAAKIARVMGKDASYTRKIVRDARAELDEEAAKSAVSPSQPETKFEASRVPPRVGDGMAGSTADDLEDADPFAGAAPAYATH